MLYLSFFFASLKRYLCSSAFCFRGCQWNGNRRHIMLASITRTCCPEYVKANIFMCCVMCSCFLIPSLYHNFWTATQMDGFGYKESNIRGQTKRKAFEVTKFMESILCYILSSETGYLFAQLFIGVVISTDGVMTEIHLAIIRSYDYVLNTLM